MAFTTLSLNIERLHKRDSAMFSRMMTISPVFVVSDRRFRLSTQGYFVFC